MTLGPRGRKAKGDLGERTIKLKLEALGHTVLDGRMTEPCIDLILICCKRLVEVKVTAWNRLPSHTRQDCARAGDLWFSRGIIHTVVCQALSESPMPISVGMRGGHASMLYKPYLFLKDACGTPLPIGGDGGAVSKAVCDGVVSGGPVGTSTHHCDTHAESRAAVVRENDLWSPAKASAPSTGSVPEARKQSARPAMPYDPDSFVQGCACSCQDCLACYYRKAMEARP